MIFPDECTALITGASCGIGEEFARQLAPRANVLVLVARRLERLEALKSELLAANSRIRIFTKKVDLADDAQVGEFLAWLDGSGLQVDLLVNNAGLGDHGPFETGEWARLERILAVNIGALTRLTHHMLPTLLRQPRAAILNVSSIAGLVPIPGLAVYAASKAYVSSFTEALRAELRGANVSVTGLCPGPVDTEFGKVASRGDASGGDDRFQSPEFFIVTREQVVRKALVGVERDRARVIPGALVAFVMIVASMIPIFVLRFFLNRPARRFSTIHNA
jgi:short-subunit dehydrogenase